MSSTIGTRTDEAQPPSPSPSADRPIVFTDAAIKKVLTFSGNHEDARGKLLRLYVQGGGCSGFEYGFTFDEPKEGDARIPQGEGQNRIEVLVDAFSLAYLEGSVVDYFENFSGSGFKVKNPNASGTCGCGQSFSA